MAERMRLELRLDQPVYAAVKDLADRADVSVNRLVQGILRWAVQNATVGAPRPAIGGFIETLPEPSVVWFGQDGMNEENPGYGEVYFALDFSDRHVLRQGVEYHDG